MRTHAFELLDVFTDRPFRGNPLAVFPDAQGLEVAEMQAIARQMNLSETVFVLPPRAPEAQVRMRIFTVDRELPLAGHPVIGTHIALARAGRYELGRESTVVHAELEAGVLPAEIRTQDGEVQRVVMDQRLPAFGPPIQDRALVAAALGIDEYGLGPGELPVTVVDTGVPWLIVPVVDLPTMRNVAPDFARCRQLADIAGTELFYAFTQETEDPNCAAHTRHVWYGAVTPGEDAATGSASGCLGSYLVANEVLLAAPTAVLRIEQGLEIGREGKVDVEVTAQGTNVKRVQVGGQAVSIGRGEIDVP